jgi:protein-S-isoprenylcysteine O-methyltransferase Ste14
MLGASRRSPLLDPQEAMVLQELGAGYEAYSGSTGRWLPGL